jgi:hyaluronan synthase
VDDGCLRNPGVTLTLRQQAGLDGLRVIAERQAGELPEDRDGCRAWRRDANGAGRGRLPVLVAPRQAATGALADSYLVPECTLRRSPASGIALTVVLLALVFTRYYMFSWRHPGLWPLEAIWSGLLASMVVQWLWSWLDQPARCDRHTQTQLDALRVTVAIPVYNEDPALLDRALFALLRQTRPPQVVHVVDDGSNIDYEPLRGHWEGYWPCGTEVQWTRQEVNAGKKAAQGVCFSRSAADIFVIMDSDTCLDRHAIQEGLKPFADHSVASVAGVELAANARKNWLTLTVSVRSLFFQMLPCAAQSAVGDLLINRGAYFLIRGRVVRKYLNAYLNETFFGHPIRLGDDAALTLFARAEGRTVQQGTAFAMTMYPETLRHHFRQWIRWMRGSTIRSLWRIRYLSPLTFGWWFAVLGIYSLFVSTAIPVVIVADLPRSANAGIWLVVSMVAWGYVYGIRAAFSVHRSDESFWTRLSGALVYPAVLLWGLVMLRPLRVWGTLTCLNQGWVTRANGAEVWLGSVEAEEALV